MLGRLLPCLSCRAAARDGEAMQRTPTSEELADDGLDAEPTDSSFGAEIAERREWTCLSLCRNWSQCRIACRRLFDSKLLP